MTSIDHLLPTPDEAVRCTEYRRRLDIDPGGTAIRADRVVLIGAPLPWPKPVFDHPALQAVSPIIKGASVPTRTLAYVPAPPDSDSPSDGAPGAGLGTHTAPVISFDRLAADLVIERRYQPSSEAELMVLAHAFAANDIVTLEQLAGYEQSVTRPVALVCTQGSHDVCCGSEGARFALEAEAAGDELVTYRVSHTGGHRFAPTAMTLPDGRMWADLDLALLRQILSRTGRAADLADRCRGWWGAETGPAQIAERAVFAEAGWELEGLERTVGIVEVANDGQRCVVTAGTRSWSMIVTPGRTVPTVACRVPGGLPAKQATEYTVADIQAH